MKRDSKLYQQYASPIWSKELSHRSMSVRFGPICANRENIHTYIHSLCVYVHCTYILSVCKPSGNNVKCQTHTCTFNNSFIEEHFDSFKIAGFPEYKHSEYA